jgi:hypothetical protein
LQWLQSLNQEENMSALVLANGLPPEVEKAIGLMVRGKPPDHRPLSLPAAAVASGVGIRALQRFAETKSYQQAFMMAIENYRASLEPENLRVATEIRDKPGDGSTERDNTRLRAIMTIRGSPKQAAININMQQNIVNQDISPGYVIKLDGDGGPMIEHDDAN